MWPLVLLSSVGCYLEKLLGLAVPQRLLAGPGARAAVLALPVALLAALVLTGTFGRGTALVMDARAVGLVVAVLLAWRRAPLLVVLGGAVVATALTRALL